MYRSVIAVLLVATSACALSRNAPVPDDAELVFFNVTVIDVETGALLPETTVRIMGDRIVGVESTGDRQPSAGTQVVDGRGKFLIPGLWDMHVHLSDAGATDLELFVAHGVTGVRDMGGNWQVLQSWRDRIESGEIAGPRVKTAGVIIESSPWLEAVRSIPEGRAFLEGNPRLSVETVAEARAAVDSLARLGVDLIKVRNAPPPEAYVALVEEARRRDLPVAGHFPRVGLGFEGVLEAGPTSIEHIDAFPDELDAVAPADRRRLYARMADRPLWLTPTLVADLSRVYAAEVVSAVVEDSLGLLDPRREYISDPLLTFWRVQAGLDKYNTPRDWDTVLSRALEYTGAMAESGVPLLAGTDFGARLVYPGWSLHDELALLVEYLGLSPLEALQSATRNAADALGVDDDFGSVVAGKRADLVLLDANPLEDIRNSERIDVVVLGGRLLTRDRIDDIKGAALRTLRPNAVP